MARVAVTYSPEVGGSSVISLKKAFQHVGSEVIDGDYREMMQEIPKEEFDKLYSTEEGRQRLFAHAKSKAIELLKDIEVLALSGNSAMIDPELFNQAREKDQKYDLSRTIAELALVHVATEFGMPIFGVCGGHQVIAVYGGGEISNLNSDKLDKQRFMNYDAIKLNKNSMIAQIIGRKKAPKKLDDGPASTHDERAFFGAHNQVVSKLGSGFEQTGIASDNQSIEAAESELGVPIITTQFHPEVGAKGLPNSEFVYKRPKADREMNLDIFRYLDKAGDAYSKKKTVMDELRLFKPKETVEKEHIDVTPNIKPPDIKKTNNNKKQQNQEEHVSEKQEKQSSSKQDKNSVFWSIVSASGLFFKAIGLAIISAFNSVKEIFGQPLGIYLRDKVSNKLTSEKVSSLKQKEKELSRSEELDVGKDGPLIKNSSYTVLLTNFKAKSPSEILRETPAKIWTKLDDDLEVIKEEQGQNKASLGADKKAIIEPVSTAWKERKQEITNITTTKAEGEPRICK